MDRFVVREPRVGADYPQGNQMVQFSPNAAPNRNMMPETMYFGGYGAELPAQHAPRFMMGHVSGPHYAPNVQLANGGAGHPMSGIDPRYLAAYADNSATYIAGQGQVSNMDQPLMHANGPFENDYENRSFSGVYRNKPRTFIPQVVSTSNEAVVSAQKREEIHTNKTLSHSNRSSFQESIPSTSKPAAPAMKTTIARAPADKKAAIQFPMKTRVEKLRELHKSGARAFTGPVEKVLKWHKALQDLGLLVIYEVVAKCVSVRSGESCAKICVVRDDNGPAMEVVYYEIDFLLPELKTPCFIRVVGRMMPGTCRLQAFSVRPANGDDVSTLPRRAAVAAHHVSKLCKEYCHPTA